MDGADENSVLRLSSTDQSKIQTPDSSWCNHRDHDTWCNQAQGHPPAEEIFAPQPQSFDAAVGDRDAQTALRPLRPRDSKFQPKLGQAHV